MQPLLRFLLLTLALLAIQVAFFLIPALPTIAWRFAAAHAAIGPILWLVPLPVFIWLILALVHLRAAFAAPRRRCFVGTPPCLPFRPSSSRLVIAVNAAMHIAAARVHGGTCVIATRTSPNSLHPPTSPACLASASACRFSATPPVCPPRPIAMLSNASPPPSP